MRLVHSDKEEYTVKQTKKLSILAAGAFAIGLLLGTSAAQAAVVTDGPVATGITDLDVNGTTYNVQSRRRLARW